jgi:hypothetical protein
MALTLEQQQAILAIANGSASPADGGRITPQVASPASPAPAPAPPSAPSPAQAPPLPTPPPGFGLVQHNGMWIAMPLASAAPPAPPAPRPTYQRPLGPPASDAGGPAAPARSLEGASLFTMSEADRAHLIREKGLDWYRKTLQEQSRSTNVKLR